MSEQQNFTDNQQADNNFEDFNSAVVKDIIGLCPWFPAGLTGFCCIWPCIWGLTGCCCLFDCCPLNK